MHVHAQGKAEHAVRSAAEASFGQSSVLYRAFLSAKWHYHCYCAVRRITIERQVALVRRAPRFYKHQLALVVSSARVKVRVALV